MAIGALVVVGCAGAGAFVSLGTNLLGGGMTSTTSAPDSFLPLAEMTVNLASSDAVMRLRLELAVPSGQESTVEEVEVHIRDAFVGFLRQVDAGDLRGSAGMYWLRAELLHRAREVAGEKAVREVLIQDFLIR